MPNSLPDSSPDSLSVDSAVTDLEANATGGEAESAPRSGQRSPGLLGLLWMLVFRTGLMVVGGGMALVVGMAIATRYPAEIDDPPVLEKILQGVENIR